MAVPAYDVLHNIFLSPDLTQTEQRQLAGAFYRAYRTQMNGARSRWMSVWATRWGVCLNKKEMEC